MKRIESLADLMKVKESVQQNMNLREYCNFPEKVVQLNVSMGEEGIEAGAKEIYDYLFHQMASHKIASVVCQVPNMGYGAQEPCITVQKPGEEKYLLLQVTKEKTDSLIQDYLLKGNKIEGMQRCE